MVRDAQQHQNSARMRFTYKICECTSGTHLYSKPAFYDQWAQIQVISNKNELLRAFSGFPHCPLTTNKIWDDNLMLQVYKNSRCYRVNN